MHYPSDQELHEVRVIQRVESFHHGRPEAYLQGGNV